MNFLLKNIELHLPEHCLLNAEKLFEQGKVSNLYESDRHLWVAEVSENEVEIQISPSKVIAYSCECASHQNNIVCEHIGATLLALRKQKSLKEDKKKSKKIRRSNPKRLTTNSVFEYANKEDLIVFMRQYAKINRQFSLALKARFAAVVPMDNNYDKYAQLFDATINAYRKKDDTINYSGSIQILGISKQLIGLAKDEIALENLSEGFIILECLIKKLTPILQKIENNQEKTRVYVEASFLTIEKLLGFEPAPTLIDQIRLFCLEEISKPVYLINEFSLHFIHLLKIISIEKKELSEVSKVIDYELKNEELPESLRANLMVEKMQILDKLGSKNKIDELISQNLENPKLIIAVIENSIKNKDFKRAESLAQKGLQQTYSRIFQIKLEDALLKIHINQNDKTQITHFSKELFQKTLDLDYFLICKENTSQDWNRLVDSMLTYIQNLPFSIKKRDITAKLFIEENRLEDLLEYMKNLGSLDLVRIYDKYLLPEKKLEVFELYHQLLTNYLNHHYGRIPMEKIKDTIQHLFEIGANDLASKLIKKIKSDFAERPTLIKELKLL